jgi:hypothetical protein
MTAALGDFIAIAARSFPKSVKRRHRLLDHHRKTGQHILVNFSN